MCSDRTGDKINMVGISVNAKGNMMTLAGCLIMLIKFTLSEKFIEMTNVIVFDSLFM